jgi:hypothetical protein
MDDGARILGEVAFGLNYEIDRFTRNILFDEKIGARCTSPRVGVLRRRAAATSQGSTGT